MWSPHNRFFGAVEQWKAHLNGTTSRSANQSRDVAGARIGDLLRGLKLHDVHSVTLGNQSANWGNPHSKSQATSTSIHHPKAQPAYASIHPRLTAFWMLKFTVFSSLVANRVANARQKV